MARLTGRDDDADTAAEAAREIERLRLTDEEREAIESAAGICEEHAEEYDGVTNCPIAATLRKLLERLA